MEMMKIVIRKLKKNIIATVMLKSQNRATKIHARLKVTTCLYLSPINRARSLSTLIAVNVNKDTPANIAAKLLKILKIQF